MNSKRSFKRIIKQENGSGLVLTLMVLMVLSVLGAALATVTIGSYRATANNRNYVSAYYVAEAGLNQAYEEIKTAVKDAYELNDNQEAYFTTINSFLNSKSGSSVNDFKSQFGENPKAEIKIETTTGGNPREYKLISTGKIGQATREISKIFTVEYKNKNSGGTLPDFPDNAAALVKSKIHMEGSGSITGNVYFDSTESHSIYLRGGAKINTGNTYVNKKANIAGIADVPKDWDYKKVNGPYFKKSNATIPWDSFDQYVESFPEFPVYPTLKDETVNDNHGNSFMIIKNGSFYHDNSILYSKQYTLDLTEDVFFKDFIMNTNTTLKIDTNGKDIDIVVNNFLDKQGSIEILGEGSITFYIKNDFELKSNSDSHLNINGKTEQLRILYGGVKDFKMSGGIVNGYLFIKNSNIYINSQYGIKGLVLSGGNYIEHNGYAISDATVIAPKATYNFKSSGRINGFIVSNKIEASGSGEMRFQDNPYDINIFNTNTPPEDNTDLIISEPSIELSD